MKKVLGFSILMIMALLLSACGSAGTPTTSNSMDEIYTAVASTLDAQAIAPAIATVTLLPTSTLVPTSTLYASPTMMLATSTSPIWYSVSGVNYGCYDSVYVKDMTIPDGTVLTPGETFVKTWKLQNTGSCSWTNNFSVVFVNGDDMDGSDTEIDQTVNVTKKAEISVELTAPDDEGTYTGYWRLADEYGNLFGELISVQIVVAEPTATSTPTVTYTPTNTSIATATSSSTSTLVPSNTPIATNIPTEASTLTPTIVPSDTPVPAVTLEDDITPTYP